MQFFYFESLIVNLIKSSSSSGGAHTGIVLHALVIEINVDVLYKSVLFISILSFGILTNNINLLSKMSLFFRFYLAHLDIFAAHIILLSVVFILNFSVFLDK